MDSEKKIGGGFRSSHLQFPNIHINLPVKHVHSTCVCPQGNVFLSNCNAGVLEWQRQKHKLDTLVTTKENRQVSFICYSFTISFGALESPLNRED